MNWLCIIKAIGMAIAEFVGIGIGLLAIVFIGLAILESDFASKISDKKWFHNLMSIVLTILVFGGPIFLVCMLARDWYVKLCGNG